MTAGFFLEMGWKSALIAGAVLVLATALRSRSAADRAMVLRIGIVMLLILPVIALALPALQIAAWAAPEAPAQLAAFAASEMPTATPTGAMILESPEPTIWDDPTPLVVLAYLGGLLMAGSRLLAGLWTLRGWTRAARDVTDPEWLQAFDQVRWAAPNGERLRLLVSDEVPSPLSWGWRNPVILIDPDTLDLPDDAAAILAHEVAHVARRDWPALMLSRVAAALFWFNPLVWALEREVIQQAEEAADCEAVDCIEPARYAETLLSWAQCNRRGLPANSIAPSKSALGRRVRTILDGRLRERPSGSAWTALAVLMCIGIATPVAALELVEAEAPLPPRAPLAPVAPIAALPPAAVAAVPSAPAAPAALPLVSAITIIAHPHPAEAVPPVPPVPATPRVAPAPPAPPAALRAPRRPHAAARPDGLVDVDTLVALSVHGVTPQFVAELEAIDRRYGRLSADQLTAMRIHGVSPRFIRDMAGAGYPGLSAEQLVTMRIHGVTAERARRAASRAGGRPSPERLVEMTIHGKN